MAHSKRLKTIVHKGGGFCCKSAEIIRSMNRVIEHSSKKYTRQVIVLSAPGELTPGDKKITDLLFSFHEAPTKQKVAKWAEIVARYEKIISDLGITDCMPTPLQMKLKHHEYTRDPNAPLSVKEFFSHMFERILRAKSVAFTAGSGEYMMAWIFTQHLKHTGKNAEFVDAKDLIFVNADNTANHIKTDAACKKLLSEEKLYIVPGFYVTNSRGKIKLLPRDGSDLSATFIYDALHADDCILWKDVPGIMQASPKLVDNPKLKKVITATEVRQLSYMGSSIVNSEALQPLERHGLTLQVRNILTPEKEGTLVVQKLKRKKNTLVGVACKPNFISIVIKNRLMNERIGWADKILAILAKCGINIEHTPTGIDVFTVALCLGRTQEQIADTRKKLSTAIRIIKRKLKPDSLHTEDELSLIAVVGTYLEGRTLSVVQDRGIKVELITYSKYDGTLIFGVKEKHAQKSVQTLIKKLA